MKKKLIKDNLYWIIPSIFGILYCIAFDLLESRDTIYHLVSSPIDQYIPFSEYFIIPYFFWFVYMAYAIYEFFIYSKKDFIKLCIYLSFGMGLFVILSYLYPTILDLRPSILPQKNIFMAMVGFLYKVDTPTNVFPSIHVYNSLAVFVTQYYSPLYKHKPIKKWCSFIIMVSIVLSTMFLKQHSILDVFGASLLGILPWVAIYSPLKLDLFKKDYLKASHH